jgi:hypothetical protein
MLDKYTARRQRFIVEHNRLDRTVNARNLKIIRENPLRREAFLNEKMRQVNEEINDGEISNILRMSGFQGFKKKEFPRIVIELKKILVLIKRRLRDVQN